MLSVTVLISMIISLLSTWASMFTSSTGRLHTVDCTLESVVCSINDENGPLPDYTFIVADAIAERGCMTLRRIVSECTPVVIDECPPMMSYESWLILTNTVPSSETVLQYMEWVSLMMPKGGCWSPPVLVFETIHFRPQSQYSAYDTFDISW